MVLQALEELRAYFVALGRELEVARCGFTLSAISCDEEEEPSQTDRLLAAREAFVKYEQESWVARCDFELGLVALEVYPRRYVQARRYFKAARLSYEHLEVADGVANCDNQSSYIALIAGHLTEAARRVNLALTYYRAQGTEARIAECEARIEHVKEEVARMARFKKPRIQNSALTSGQG